MNTVVVELVSGYCNSRCLWCFTQYKCIDRMDKGMMPYANFRQFIDLNDRMSLIPFSHGEALLHPDFAKCCRYALSCGYTLASIHTNLAMQISDDTFGVLSKFNSVTVNVGGATSPTQATNMHTSLGLVLDNLRTLEMLGTKVMGVKMVVNKHNINEVKLLHKVIAQISPRIAVNTYPLYFSPADSDNEDKLKFYSNNMEGNSKVGCRDIVEVKDGQVITSPKTDKCYGLIPTVRVNGNLEICCRGRYLERSLGNCFEKPLSKLLSTREYKQAVKEGLNREYIQYCQVCS